jgi:hypothetical protein
VVWRDRLEKVQSETVPACDLYMGDHWRAAREAFAAAARYTPRAELWVLSAGYGLIMSRTAIKPYSATFASGSTDSVWRGPRDGTRKACLNRWWQSLPSQSTIAELIRGDATVLVAAGASYVDAISDELTKARRSGAADDNLFIVSAGSPPDGAFLPASGRLRSAVGGTDSSLNARLLALLATTAGRHCFRRDAMVAEFARLAGRTSSARRVAGRSAPDDELVRQIVAIRRTRPAASRTYALRELRSAGIACEHSRFASLWNRVSADGTAG